LAQSLPLYRNFGHFRQLGNLTSSRYKAMNPRNLNQLVASCPHGSAASTPTRHRDLAHRRSSIFLENVLGSRFPFLPEIEFLLEPPIDQSELVFEPSLSLHENDDAFHLTVEMPGVSKEDLSLEIKDNTLFLQGEKVLIHAKSEAGPDQECHAQERSYGKFERQIEFPGEIDAEGAKATYRDGILAVRLPKTKAGQSVRLLVDF
jgi:HSP20 family protein